MEINFTFNDLQATTFVIDTFKDYALIIVLVFWEVFWKYHALWLSARNSDQGWFTSILIINSCGLLPIYYLYKNNFFKK